MIYQNRLVLWYFFTISFLFFLELIGHWDLMIILCQHLAKYHSLIFTCYASNTNKINESKMQIKKFMIIVFIFAQI